MTKTKKSAVLKPKKPRSKSYGRTKGLNFERFVAIQLRSIFPDVRRQLEFQKSEAVGVDLANTGYFKIQCKCYHNYVNPNKIEEVQCDELLGDVPVLIMKAHQRRPLVALPLEEFIRLLKSAGV